jgi:two-component system, OmpR family, phosphate regulon sensor histidine kinase PhoR
MSNRDRWVNSNKRLKNATSEKIIKFVKKIPKVQLGIRKRFSLIVVVFSALSMIGLLLVQYYWTRNTISSSESNFERSVQEAMSRVIYQTEKMEIAQRIKGRYKSIGKGTDLFNTVDSINQLLFNEFDKMFADSLVNDSIINITKERISIEISQDKYGQPVTKIDTSYIVYEKSKRDFQDFSDDFSPETGSDGNVLHGGHGDVNMVDMNVDSLMQEFDKFLKRTFIVSDIFEDMFNLTHFLPIEERVNVEKLDSMIKLELNAKGIELEYEFGIFSAFQKEMVYEKTGKYSEELLSEGQSFQLFPSDFFSVPNYLVVYFPKRKSFLLKQMQFTLILSFVLISLIITIFSYVLISFIRQKRLSEERNDFINNMTHEFKTPISTISLACEAMKDSHVNQDASMRDTYVDIIRKENMRLATMAEKILQTAIIDHGQLKLKKDIVDAKKSIAGVIDTITLQLEQRQGSIHTFFLAANHTIAADKVHFTNIIYNLLDNAIKFSRETPEIIIKTFNERNNLIIEVIDKGIGISKHEQKRVFEKLYRVSSGNVHDVKGFGLGLSYVKAIVELHKGSISLESEPGKGSSFKLSFKNIEQNGK